MWENRLFAGGTVFDSGTDFRHSLYVIMLTLSNGFSGNIISSTIFNISIFLSEFMIGGTDISSDWDSFSI